jgi:dipeptidyl aminopeptidase/acylaminoacyl peptidase
MLKKLCVVGAALLCAGSVAFAQAKDGAKPPARLPVEAFAAGPSVTGAELSPSGRYVAFVQQLGGERYDTDELVIHDRATGANTIISRAREEIGVQISWVSWKSDDTLIVGTANRLRIDNDFYWIPRVMAMSRAGANSVLLFEDQSSRLAARFAPIHLSNRLPRDPDHVLLEAWGPNGNALWRADIKTGRVERIDSGRWETAGWMVDITGQPVLRMDELPRNTGIRFMRRAPGERDWTLHLELKKAAAVNAIEFLPFAATGKPGELYVAVRREGDDLAGIHVMDTATGAYGPQLMAHPRADISDALIDPASRELVAVCADVQKYECIGRDRSVSRYINAIDAFFGRNSRVSIVSTSDDMKVWLLHVEQAGEPPAYFMFDRDAVKIDPLASAYLALHGAPLAPVAVHAYKSRDGVDLWGYLTNPPAAGQRPKALVVLPHGGPEQRDASGFNDWAQFLASRGYAVFQPNFRGGGGFGRAFAEAGHRQWGRRMQDDVTDGVKHLIETGQADPARICIFGWSYGGYAALAGGALTPELYRCVIAGAGVSDLPKMLEYERVQSGNGSAGYAYWLKALGDPSRDRAALEAVSPRLLAANFRAPVLLIHGEDDGVVEADQSRLMERALKQAGKPVRLVTYRKEGHAPDNWEPANRVAYLREIETFLAQHLPPQ